MFKKGSKGVGYYSEKAAAGSAPVKEQQQQPLQGSSAVLKQKQQQPQLAEASGAEAGADSDEDMQPIKGMCLARLWRCMWQLPALVQLLVE